MLNFYANLHSYRGVTMRSGSVLLVIKTILLVVSCVKLTTLVNLPQGKLSGVETSKGTLKKYLGIPYGTVVERYQGPGPPPRWKDVLNATYTTNTCPQYHERLGIPIGDESCLTLNIFSPGSINHKRLYPVMVFMQGSGQSSGNSNLVYNPEPIVANGVIVITVNYRLGVFGFLCLKIKGAHGNAGLKDQVAALKWIKDNIKHFSGNPNSITIFGEGDGSSSVSHLILSSQARGLFNRAIMESGSVLSPFAFTEDPITIASLVATRLGYNTKNPYELLNVYRNSSKNDIILASVDDSSHPLSNYIFKPCVEKHSEDLPFLTKTPKEILESGNFNKMPLIIGYNNKDGMSIAAQFNDTLLEQLNQYFEIIIPENIFFSNLEDKEAIINEVKLFYFGDNKIINEDTKNNLTDYFSDILFHYPSVAFSNYMLKNSDHPVFNYYFKYDSSRNLAKFLSGLSDQEGAILGDELFYLFQPIILWPVPLVGDDKHVMQRMTTMWSNFAKFGDPTAIRSSILPTKWSPNKNATQKYLTINKNDKMEMMPNSERMEFWRYIYNKYGV